MLNFDVASKAAVQISKDRCRKYCCTAVSLSSAEAPAGYPHQNIKISIIEKIESARGTMGRGKRRELSLFSLPPSHRAPRALFFFLPSLPTTQRASPQHKEASAEERAAVFYEKQMLPRFFYFLRTAKKFIEDCSIHVQFPKLI